MAVSPKRLKDAIKKPKQEKTLDSKLIKELEKILKSNRNFMGDGKLLKNKIKEDILKEDSILIESLLENPKTKKYFFISTGKILVFKNEMFLRFLDLKNFLPSSYTSFRNKIGLSDDNEYLKENNNIILSFPYKDCVLIGGQVKDETNLSKKEHFLNKILAPEEIDVLLEPKVFDNVKRIGIEETNVEQLNPKDNLIIRGNNLLALHSIKNNFMGKIKLIYIDPPYNTGNDSFSYNDNFKHSTWLTFMKNRLEVARELLRNDGSIFISIDHNELGYLLVLMDEIFGREHLRNIITIKRSAISGAKVINPGVVNISEYLVIYTKSDNWTNNIVYKEKGRDKRYNQFIKNIDDNYKKWKIITLSEAFKLYNSKISSINKISSKNKELDDFVIKNRRNVIQFASMDESSVNKDALKLKQKSKKEPNKIFHLERDGNDDYYVKNGKMIIFYEKRIKEIDGKLTFVDMISDIWDDISISNNDKNIGSDDLVYKKSSRDKKYNQFIKNIDDDCKKWEIITLIDAFNQMKHEDSINHRDSQINSVDLDNFVIENRRNIIRFAAMDESSIKNDALKLKAESKNEPNKIFHLARDKNDDYYIKNGQMILFYEKRIKEIDGKITFADLISDIWDDVPANNIHNEGGVKLRKGKKPEKMLRRIIEIATNEGDLVLDFFLGSGTTAAVAHKLRRRYIGIEQLDYCENDCVERLKNTIRGEQSGISKACNWTGGGDFVYCELREINQGLIHQIEKAKNNKELLQIWEKIKETRFLNYKLNIKKFEDNSDNFAELSLAEQKSILIECLDKNQLYLNYSEIDDESYNISNETKKFNRTFYSGWAI